jgi:NADH-quinone oxidoreductase subunit K
MLSALNLISQNLNAYLVLSGLLFSIGAFGFLARRNAISMLMSIELMLNAVNLAFIAFGAFIYNGDPQHASQASVIALIVMAAAAAEATVGLAIVIAIYRNRKTPLVDEYDAMRQ